MRLRIVSSVLVISLFVLACGKKGPPTLKAFEKPGAPSGLAAVHKEDAIVLSWSYPADSKASMKGFHLLRSGDNGFGQIAFISNNTGSFIDRDFRLQSTYRYKVIAESSKGVLSNDSNIIAVTPESPPPPPETFRFAVQSEFIELSWDSSGKGICYNIYKSTEKGKFGELPVNGKPLCVLSFHDAVLLPDRPVYYMLRAMLNTDILDEGYASSEVEVNPSHFVPSPPSDLRVVKHEDKVFLIWKESPESWIRGYRVYRKREEAPEFTAVGDVKTPSFEDSERTGKRVQYMIRTLGPIAESSPLLSPIL